MRAAIKSNYLLGDMVYVATQGFKGLAKVSGVENKLDGIYYYLTTGPDSDRVIIYAHETEVEAGIPIVEKSPFNQRKVTFFVGRSSKDDGK